MQPRFGVEFARSGDRLRSGSCIFLLGFAMVTERTLFGIAFDAETLDDTAIVEYTGTLAARRVASSSVQIAAPSPPWRPATSAKR